MRKSRAGIIAACLLLAFAACGKDGGSGPYGVNATPAPASAVTPNAVPAATRVPAGTPAATPAATPRPTPTMGDPYNYGY